MNNEPENVENEVFSLTIDMDQYIEELEAEIYYTEKYYYYDLHEDNKDYLLEHIKEIENTENSYYESILKFLEKFKVQDDKTIEQIKGMTITDINDKIKEKLDNFEKTNDNKDLYGILNIIREFHNLIKQYIKINEKNIDQFDFNSEFVKAWYNPFRIESY